MIRYLAVVLALTPTLALAQATNYVYDTTTNSTSTSTNTNNNNNTSTSTNTNVNQNINSGTMTNNNNNTSTSTNINQNINSGTMTNINQNTSTSTSVNSNSNHNYNTDVSNSTVNSTSNATTNNTNINQNVNDSRSTSYSENVSRQIIDQNLKSPPPSAIAPSMMSYSQDLCTTGISGAVQTQIVGISGGKAVRDSNCERIKLSKTLYDMGMRVAAVSLLCQDERVFRSMEMAGTPCPYMGKIGADATDAWKENADARPDAKRSR
jgi:hypothetical protein